MSEPIFAHPPWAYVFVDEAGPAHPGFLRIRERDGRPGSVILALRGHCVAVVEVFRRPLGRALIELPRGFRDGDESSAAAAQRELFEETGIDVKVEDLESLGDVAPNGGILESIVEVFFVRVKEGVSANDSSSDGEVRRVMWVSTTELLEMVRDGKVIDGFTMSALLRGSLRGLFDNRSGEVA